jgi:hypothetical protein
MIFAAKIESDYFIFIIIDSLVVLDLLSHKQYFQINLLPNDEQMIQCSGVQLEFVVKETIEKPIMYSTKFHLNCFRLI